MERKTEKKCEKQTINKNQCFYKKKKNNSYSPCQLQWRSGEKKFKTLKNKKQKNKIILLKYNKYIVAVALRSKGVDGFSVVEKKYVKSRDIPIKKPGSTKFINII